MTVMQVTSKYANQTSHTHYTSMGMATHYNPKPKAWTFAIMLNAAKTIGSQTRP